MSTLFDLMLSISGPGSKYNVHSCIVGSALRDALLLNNVSSNMHYDVHLGLGQDLYKHYTNHKWVQLTYSSYNYATNTSDCGTFHISQNPLDSEEDVASVRGGPLHADNIRVYVKPTTHKTAGGFMRNTIKGLCTSADEVALDLESKKVVMSEAWIKGHNDRAITVNYGGLDDEFMRKYQDWSIARKGASPATPVVWPPSLGVASSSPIITTSRPPAIVPPDDLTFWMDAVKRVMETPPESWKKDD